MTLWDKSILLRPTDLCVKLLKAEIFRILFSTVLRGLENYACHIYCQKTNRTLKKLNGTTASTADIKEIVAQLNTFSGLNGILLYLDEIQYFNKKQQQTLLEYIENGSITLIASTTENPYFYVYNAILSRSTVFEFKPVEPDEVEKAVYRASDFLAEESGTDIEMPEECAKKIASGCGGDVRKAMNAVELSVIATDEIDGKRL